MKKISLSFVYGQFGHECKKYLEKNNQFKYWNSINWNIKILGLINNIEEYQKVCNHDWRKHEPRIEKNKWNKKLFNWRNKSTLINE